MRLLLIVAFFSFSLFASSDVHEIAKKIDALGVDDTLNEKVNYKVYDPFKRAKPLLAKKEKKTEIIKRKAIKVETILNERAWIDGKWLKKGALVNGYHITAINKNAIMLRHNKKELLIPLSQGKNFLRVKEIIK